jgi:hypothetical protein
MFPPDPPEIRAVPLHAIVDLEWRPRDTLVVPPAGPRVSDAATTAAFDRLRERLRADRDRSAARG